MEVGRTGLGLGFSTPASIIVAAVTYSRIIISFPNFSPMFCEQCIVVCEDPFACTQFLFLGNWRIPLRYDEIKATPDFTSLSDPHAIRIPINLYISQCEEMAFKIFQ